MSFALEKSKDFFSSHRAHSRQLRELDICGYDVVVNVTKTDDRKVIEKHGLSQGVCINGAPIISRMAPGKEFESIVKQMIRE